MMWIARLRRSWRWWTHTTPPWRSFRLHTTGGAMATLWGPHGGWRLTSDAGQIRLELTVDGETRTLPLDTYAAYRLACQLRDHAVSVGGIPYIAEADLDRRYELYRTRALPVAP